VNLRHRRTVAPLLALPALALSAALLAGCGAVATHTAAAGAHGAGGAVAGDPAAPTLARVTHTRPSTIPNLGRQTLKTIPAGTREVVVVDADDDRSTTNTVTEWQRTPTGWRRHGRAIPAHNGYGGWSEHHLEGDGTSPMGTFTLTAAAGRLPDPGSRLPYEYRPDYYTIGGTFMGHSLAGAFDYLVAIDYNRVPGSPPSDERRPLGSSRGGGIWLHVDHQSPTHGCVSLPKPKMRALVRWLDPAQHPVVVMGTQAFLHR
jgi:L,D-peptidoglycan transpeptidase YkuD (ErfK/YbiS/YcfS/YnhG family)